MTAKQYLNRVRRIDKEIDSLEEMKQKTRERLESVTQNYDSDGAQSTKDPHKYDRLVELDSLIDQRISEQILLKKDTLATITQLSDRVQRMVLIKYYLQMKTWEQVAVDMNYSYMHITRIHGYALREVQKILDGRAACV